MRLQSLEIKGFKSFANPIQVNFGEDVIGIVGPNGSGKSNIVDAIRWVLGEQKSKELRLDKMTSVIFNGTKKRKQAGVASVSLTFENTKNLLPTEYHTVTITRMLYRSGESEYRLNNVQCRLKDITSLFLDTGIGSNSYAIIALGMVDDILSDKDNARRKMFEQASGISKYKIRKRETMNKLKSTEADLERIEDLLFEIEGQLATLEKQAKRTKRYFELKEQYKQLSIASAATRVEVLKEEHKDVEKKLKEEEDKYRQLEIDIRNLESALERERKQNLDKEKALSERQRELNSLVGRIRGMENDKRMLEQKVQFAEQNQRKLKEQISNATHRVGHLEGEIEEYREQLHAEKRLEAELEKQLDEVEEKLAKIKNNHGSLKSDLDVVMQEQQAVERAVFELEKTRAINQNQVETLTNDLLRTKNDTKARREEVGTLKGQIDTIEKEEKENTAKLDALQLSENQRVKDVEATETAVEEVRKKIQKVNRSIDSKKHEYKLTKDMVEKLEGFPESIKFLSNKKNWQQQASLLSDVIYVQEEYRVAIENYLEPYLNYFVVNNLEEAYGAIQLLSRSQKGKANFFLLDEFKNYEPPMTMLPETNRAIDLIECDKEYRNLVSFLLENVLVTTTDEPAKELISDEVVLLSQSGRFTQRKHSVSGGSIGLFEGKKIGRKKNLEILETDIKKLETEANKLQTEFHNLKDKLEKLKAANTSRDIQQLQQAINQLAQRKVSFSTRMENFQSFLQEADAKRDANQKRIEELTAANAGMEAQLKTQQAALLAARQAIANTDGSYRQVAEQLSAASQGYNEKNIEFIRQQNKVTSFQRELNFREKQLEETRVTLDRDQAQIANSGDEMQGVREEIELLEKSLLQSYEEKKGKAAHLTEAEQGYFQARGGINKLEDSIRQTNRQRTDSQVLVNQLKEKLTDVRFKLQAVGERLRIEFGVSINDLLNEPQEAKDARQKVVGKLTGEELTMKVEKLKNRLDNYGEINPMAVTAYDEMSERYETIVTQRADINKAKEDLKETIKEIEETATAQFIEAFDKARVYFIDVFRSLFTEDDMADLILLDPENPLESKIEIIAKPKGKRPQSISQLSGGEKTLTATALLFALYLLKPAPFCIFDEVDAPLDDANIEKFNKIIKKFSKDSQFIIVTHNKQTMAAVDVIYGVYMQEQGVSAVSAVDFRKFQHQGLIEAITEN